MQKNRKQMSHRELVEDLESDINEIIAKARECRECNRSHIDKDKVRKLILEHRDCKLGHFRDGYVVSCLICVLCDLEGKSAKSVLEELGREKA